MATLDRLPRGRYKQYGPLWQGGRSQVVASAGGRKNPLVFQKSVPVIGHLFPGGQFNGTILSDDQLHLTSIGASNYASVAQKQLKFWFAGFY